MGRVVNMDWMLLKKYSEKRVLVTGHTGFKGSWLCKVLRTLGAEVTGVALAPESNNDHFITSDCEADMARSVIGDITVPGLVQNLMKEVKPEIVFHLAAQPLVRRSYANPIETYNTNVMGSLNVLEGIRFTPSVQALVYVTSDKCYKNNEWPWGYRETDELGGHDPYSSSKALAELLFASHWKSYFSVREHFGAASARAGNVIGGGDFAADRIIPDYVRGVVSNRPVNIRNPDATRPWQHVLDPVFAYLTLGSRLIEDGKKFSGAWNFGPDSKSIRTVRDLTEKFAEIWPSARLQLDKEGGHPHEAGLLHLNCDKAHHLLGWYPVWNFDQTVEYTAEWYKSWQHSPDTRRTSQNQINKFMGLLK